MNRQLRLIRSIRATIQANAHSNVHANRCYSSGTVSSIAPTQSTPKDDGKGKKILHQVMLNKRIIMPSHTTSIDPLNHQVDLPTKDAIENGSIKTQITIDDVFGSAQSAFIERISPGLLSSSSNGHSSNTDHYKQDEIKTTLITCLIHPNSLVATTLLSNHNTNTINNSLISSASSFELHRLMGQCILNDLIDEYLHFRLPLMTMADVQAVRSILTGQSMLNSFAKAFGIKDLIAQTMDTFEAILKQQSLTDNLSKKYIAAGPDALDLKIYGKSSEVFQGQLHRQQLQQLNAKNASKLNAAVSTVSAASPEFTVPSHASPASTASPLTPNALSHAPSSALSMLMPLHLSSSATKQQLMDCTLAIIGWHWKWLGEQRCRHLLSQHFLGTQIRNLQNHLPSSKNPLSQLSSLCKRQGKEMPDVRLVGESGRDTWDEVYVVRLYSGQQECLGEGAGRSVRMAARMAAMDGVAARSLATQMARHPDGRHARPAVESAIGHLLASGWDNLWSHKNDTVLSSQVFHDSP